jgi:hypothetical protein
MPLHDFEKKLKQAAESGAHSFEEEDWQQMKLLLDKHLPNKKDNRKILFILVAFLLFSLLTGSLYFNKRSNNNYSQTLDIERSETSKKYDSLHNSGFKVKEKNQPNISIPLPDNSTTIAIQENEHVVNKEKEVYNTKPLLLNDAAHFRPKQSNNNHPMSLKAIQPDKEEVQKNVNETKHQNKNLPYNGNQTYHTHNNSGINDTDLMTTLNTDSKIISLQNNNKQRKELLTVSDKSEIQKTGMTGEANIIPAINNNPTTPDTARNNIEKINQKNTLKNPGQKNHLAITLTTGLETSGTRITAPGRLTPLYGFGVQYLVGKKIIIRTGLNVVKKIYYGRDGDYNAPPGSWAFNVTFRRIEANCKILEIPLSVAYKIKTYKKGSFFASIGSSSYIMKREDYQFYFKGQTGNDTTRSANFINNSEHYFSSLNFSAIAEKKFSNTFSLQAEPLLKVPVTGIGFGKVNIYNMGILLTAKFQLK